MGLSLRILGLRPKVVAGVSLIAPGFGFFAQLFRAPSRRIQKGTASRLDHS